MLDVHRENVRLPAPIKENSDSNSCNDGKARGTKAGKKKPQQEVVRILKALRKSVT